MGVSRAPRKAILVVAILLVASSGCEDGAAPNRPLTVERVELTPVQTPLYIGDSHQLQATLRAADGSVLTDRTVNWSSSDSAVVSISASGLLGCLGAGEAGIAGACEGRVDSLRIIVRAPKVAETTYVLHRFAAGASPFLLTDYTSPDGTRQIHWLVADTIRFNADGRLVSERRHRWSEQSEGGPEDVYEDFDSSGGYFEQQDERVAVAWSWISVPPASAYTDTLRLRTDGLVRIFKIPPPCSACPPGPVVDAVYTRLPH